MISSLEIIWNFKLLSRDEEYKSIAEKHENVALSLYLDEMYINVRNASMNTIVAQFANSHGSEGKQTRHNSLAHYFEFLYADSAYRSDLYLDFLCLFIHER